MFSEPPTDNDSQEKIDQFLEFIDMNSFMVSSPVWIKHVCNRRGDRNGDDTIIIEKQIRPYDDWSKWGQIKFNVRSGTPLMAQGFLIQFCPYCKEDLRYKKNRKATGDKTCSYCGGGLITTTTTECSNQMCNVR